MTAFFLQPFPGTFRRIIRPNGKFAGKFKNTGKLNYDRLVTQINDGTMTAAPPKQIPAALPDTKEFADKIFSANLPPWLLWLIDNSKIIFIILLILFAVLAIVTGAFVLFAILAIAAVVVYQRATSIKNDKAAAASLLDPQKELETLKAAPQQPDFTLVLSDEAVTPPPTATVAGADSVEAKNFRAASIDLTTRLAVKIPEKTFAAFSISNAQEKISAAIHPGFSFVRQLTGIVKFPDYVPITTPEKMFPAMAYPDFEDPMYRKLNDISSELLLPNVKLIPPNTISLLKTNQKFIESYMVGLNHEMGRELLWREYLTDERGSYFRQFWDVKGIIRPVDGKTEAETTETYKDIPPLDTWLRSSLLGMHNKRSATGAGDQAVLIIRGDILYRYQNTTIYVQKALPGDGGPNDPRIEQNLTNDEFGKQIKFPLYQGEILPDIKFFGFDLTIEQARGTDISPDFPGDHLGCFSSYRRLRVSLVLVWIYLLTRDRMDFHGMIWRGQILQRHPHSLKDRFIQISIHHWIPIGELIQQKWLTCYFRRLIWWLFTRVRCLKILQFNFYDALKKIYGGLERTITTNSNTATAEQTAG